MHSFREWQQAKPGKPWSASKDDIFKHWQSLPPGLPITIRPVPGDHKGSAYRFDGVRITGSAPFIDSVLSRIKDIMPYEQGPTRLQVVYHQQQDNKTEQPIPNSFVFYIQVRQREQTPAGLAK